MSKRLEMYDGNIFATEVKRRYDRVKELHRESMKKDDILRMAIQDRILGAIDNEELNRITAEAKQVDDELFKERMELRRLAILVRDIADDLMHEYNDAEWDGAKLETSINIAMIFSDVEKFEKKA